MSLTGKESVELGIQTPADKFFSSFVKQLLDFESVSDHVHEAKLHKGDGHSIGSVKQWTYTIDGKVASCQESFEAIDEQNKTLTFNLFGGDVSPQYKTLKAHLKVIDKGNNKRGAIAKWTYEYEKLREDIAPPCAYLDLTTKFTKDLDAHLIKA
ncbi:hypothetical protein PIB30_093314 [Stylosanthes scabra]|uniref:Bet v I/Major latex protein domain-containing protein n=1 Tax=Stylosanthes scabra TaxID=79078 RepID=A0ABU6WWY2_9FABA|nr:hypothetical protein [Stylosanthes scabra]